jgi:hypothetical protein
VVLGKEGRGFFEDFSLHPQPPILRFKGMNPLLFGGAVPIAGKGFSLQPSQFDLPTSDQRATHPSTASSSGTTVAMLHH